MVIEQQKWYANAQIQKNRLWGLLRFWENFWYGRFYYEQELMTQYWYFLDNVLVRKELANNIACVEYLKKIETKDL